MAYRGSIAPIPIGILGYNATKNQTEVQAGQLIRAEGVSFSSGSLRKEGGAEKYNETAISGDPAVLGAHDWWPVSSTQRLIALCDDGVLYKDSGDGSFGTALKSGMTVSATVPIFVEGGAESSADDKKLFVYTGQNQVQVLTADGATTSDIGSNKPVDWASSYPTFGLIHDTRHMGGGNSSDPHRLYYSLSTDHEDFVTAGAGSISVFPGEGDGLVGGISFNQYIVLFKRPAGIYYIDTSDPSISNWITRRVNQQVGLAGPSAIATFESEAGSGVVFLDTTGRLQDLSGVTSLSFGTRGIGRDAKIVEFMRDNLNLSELDNARMRFYPEKNELYIQLAGVGSQNLNVRLMADMDTQGLIKFHYSFRDTATCLFMRQDSDKILRPMFGDNAGFIWQLDTETRSKDGSGYSMEWQTRHDDLSDLDPILATRRKNGQFLEMIAEPKGNWALNVDIYWDAVLTQTVSFNMGVTGSALGTFVLGTDKLASSQVLNKRKRITGGGRRFSIAGRASGAGQDFSIAEALLYYKVGDER